MNVKDLAAALGMKVIQPKGEDKEVCTGYTSDLLSDVMANAKDGCALITIQAHVNTVAVNLFRIGIGRKKGQEEERRKIVSLLKKGVSTDELMKILAARR